MRLVFMVEERSMKELLEILLPKILPDAIEPPVIIAHNGKSDLAASIPRKLRAWQNKDDKFVIVHDKDSNDCNVLKSELLNLCENDSSKCLVRIVCTELESWYFGDLSAVSAAYKKDFTKLSAKRKYRDPDSIANAKDELYKLIPTYQQISGAKKIAPHMVVGNNSSHSFNVFVSGVKRFSVFEERG